MTIRLGPNAQKLIEEKIRRGGYGSAEDVVLAGLAALEREETYGEFDAGEMESLLDQGERSGDPLDAEQVFAELRSLRSKQSGHNG